MSSGSTGWAGPDRVRVVATPVPRTRLLRSCEEKLRQMYGEILEAPLPERFVKLVRDFEAGRALADRRSDPVS
ncbi:MAG TPA: NepR family anti-sigma factor [Microvirga sp.]